MTRKTTKLISASLCGCMLIGLIASSIGYNYKISASPKETLKILEIVPDIKYQELSYLSASTTPYDLNQLLGDDESIRDLKSVIPNLEVQGTKVIPFTNEKPDRENVESYAQIGYLTQDTVGLFQTPQYYSKFLVPNVDTPIYVDVDTNRELVGVFGDIDFSNTNRYSRTTTNDLYVEKENGNLIKVLDDYYDLDSDCVISKNDEIITDKTSLTDTDEITVSISDVSVYVGTWGSLVKYILNDNFIQDDNGNYIKIDDKYYDTDKLSKKSLQTVTDINDLSTDTDVFITHNGTKKYYGKWENIEIEEDTEEVISDGSLSYDVVIQLLDDAYSTKTLYIYDGVAKVFEGTYSELKENYTMEVIVGYEEDTSDSDTDETNSDDNDTDANDTQTDGDNNVKTPIKENRIVINDKQLNALIIKTMPDNPTQHFLVGGNYYLLDEIEIFTVDTFDEQNNNIIYFDGADNILYYGLYSDLVFYDTEVIDTYTPDENGVFIKINNAYYLYDALYIIFNKPNDITLDANVENSIEDEVHLYLNTYDEEKGYFRFIEYMKEYTTDVNLDDSMLTWSFVSAVDGRLYEYNYENTLWSYKEDIKNDNYTVWQTAKSTRDYTEDSIYSWSRIAYESESVDDVDGVFEVVLKDLLRPLNESDTNNWITADGNIDYKCISYADLTKEYIASFNPDIIYFNMGTNEKLAYYYDKYALHNTDNKFNYLDYTINTVPNIADGVAEVIFDRVKNDNSIVLFNSELRTYVANHEVDSLELNNLEILFLLSVNMYPNVLESLDLRELFDSKQNRANICDKFLSVTNSKTEELPLFSIDNLNCDYPMFEHKIGIIDDFYSLVTDFIKDDVVSYSELTKEIINKDETISLRTAIRRLMDARSISKIKSNTYHILEIQPCASYQGGVNYLSKDMKPNEDYWKIKMLGIDPYFTGNIEVNRLQSRTLEGIDDNLCNDYDIVFIGSNYDLLAHKTPMPGLSWPKLTGNDTITYGDIGFTGSNPKVEFKGCDGKLHEFTNFNLYTDAWGTIYADDPCHWGSRLINLTTNEVINANDSNRTPWAGHVAITFRNNSFTLSTSDGYMAYVNFPVYLNGQKYEFKATNPFDYKTSDIVRYTPSGVVGAFSMNDNGDEFTLHINKLPKWHSKSANYTDIWVDYDSNLIQGYRQLHNTESTLIIKSADKSVDTIQDTIVNIHKRAVYYLTNYQHDGEEKNLYEIAVNGGPQNDGLGYMYVLCDVDEKPTFDYTIADKEDSVYISAYRWSYYSADIVNTHTKDVNGTNAPIYDISNEVYHENELIPDGWQLRQSEWLKFSNKSYASNYEFVYDENNNLVGYFVSGNKQEKETIIENCSTYSKKVLPDGVVAEQVNGNYTRRLLKDGKVVGQLNSWGSNGTAVSMTNCSDDLFELKETFDSKYSVDSNFSEIENKPYTQIKLITDKVTNKKVGYIYSDYTVEAHTPYRMYITPSETPPKRKIETVYNDTKLDGTLYNHIGDVLQLGNSANRNQYNYSGITFKSNEFDFTRLSGNDLSLKNYNQLIAFAKSGKLLLFSHDFYNEDGSIDDTILDPYSYVYKLIHNEDINKYDINKLDDFDFNYLIDTDYRIDIISEPLVYRDYTQGSWDSNGVTFDTYNDKDGGKKSYSLSELGIDSVDDKANAFYINDKTATIEFKVTQLGDYTTNYNVKLFIDSISDGVFEDLEEIKDIRVQSGGNLIPSDGLVSNGTYSVTFDLDDDFSGIVHWQLRLAKNDIADAYKSKDNYFAIKSNTNAEKQIVKILQILPEDNKTTFDLVNDEKFNTYVKALDGYEIVIFSTTENKLVSGDTLKPYAVPLGECKQTYESKGLKYEELNGLKLNNFDIIVLGFGDYNNCVTKKCLLDALQSFTESGKSIILSHDNIDFNNNVNSSKDVSHTYFNKYFRTLAGQDRFGVNVRIDDEKINYENIGTSNDNTYFLKYGLNNSDDGLSAFRDIMTSKGFDYSADIEKYTTDGIEAISDGFALSLNNSNISGGQYLLFDFYNVYKLGSHDKEHSSSWDSADSPDTSHLTCSNRGQISTYPYYISDDMQIAPTHPQYYQVNLDDKDLTVWYTIEGVSDSDGKSDLYNYYLSADTKDARNNYYIYTNGNVIYTGIGHSADITDEEYKLFVNTLFMAFRKSITAPELILSNTNAIRTKDLSYLYIDSDFDKSTELLDVDLIDATTMRLYFKIKDKSKALNKTNYIQLQHTNKEGITNSLATPIYRLDGTPLDLTSEDIRNKVCDIAMTDITDNIYTLGSATEFYTDVSLDELLAIYNDSETMVLDEEQYFKLDLKAWVYTTYGSTSQIAYDTHDISIVKRDLFDIQ